MKFSADGCVRDRAFDQCTSQALADWLWRGGSLVFLPDEFEYALTFLWLYPPFQQDGAADPRQGAIFDCVGRQFMQYQAKWRRKFGAQRHRLPFETIS
jgi:hypothetical protein